MSTDRTYKKGKRLKTFTKIWAILYLITLFIFEAAMLILDVLPKKMLLAVFVTLVIISAVLFVQLFVGNIKKSRKIAAIIISTLLMIVYCVGASYASSTNTFLNKVTAGKKNVDAVDINTKSFTVLISGMDTTGKITEEARSDVNMLVTINPKTHKVLMTSIPRDYKVKLQNGDYDKLTHTGMMGVDETIKDIEDLLDIKINYYIKVNYNTLKDLVNSIGGITVVSDKTFVSYIGHYRFVEGENELDGAKALAFARERQAYSDGDNHRVKNQQAVLVAIVNKMTKSTALLTRYNKILKYLAPTMEMNFSGREVKGLVKYQLKEKPKWKFEKISLEGFDSFATVYSAGAQKVYVMQPDEKSVKKAHDEIEHIKKPKKKKNKKNSGEEYSETDINDDTLDE